MIDLDHLEAMADAATPGIRRVIGNDRMWAGVNGDTDWIVPTIRRRNAEFIAACDPATVKELIRIARASVPATGTIDKAEITDVQGLDDLVPGSIFQWQGLIYRQLVGGGSICLEGATGEPEYLLPTAAKPVRVMRFGDAVDAGTGHLVPLARVLQPQCSCSALGAKSALRCQLHPGARARTFDQRMDFEKAWDTRIATTRDANEGKRS